MRDSTNQHILSTFNQQKKNQHKLNGPFYSVEHLKQPITKTHIHTHTTPISASGVGKAGLNTLPKDTSYAGWKN